MTTRLETVEAAIVAAGPELKEIQKAESELDIRKSKLAALVGESLSKLPAFTGEDEDADEEELDDLRDKIETFAWRLGMTWSGNWENGDGWEPGQRPEFWVPSTC